MSNFRFFKALALLFFCFNQLLNAGITQNLYVLNSHDSISVIDITTDTVTTVIRENNESSPRGITATPDG